MKMNRCTVIGAGHGGKAMAAHMAIMGLDVVLYNRTWRNVATINDRGGISLINQDGKANRFGKLALVTSHIEEAVLDSQVIMVVVPASAHKDIARKVAPYLQDDQIIVLNPGRTFGAFEFQKILHDNGCRAKVVLAETQTFIYASRSEGPAQARILRIKDAVPLAAFPAEDTPKVLAAIRPVYPQFIDGETVLHTGLNNIGAIFHPTITLHNAGWIEATGGDFQFYIDGVTPTVAKVMEAVDRERVRVAEAIGVEATSAIEWLKMAYNSEGENLYEAIHNQEGYRGIKAPATINHRYINEDVPMSLVPLASLGRNLGIKVRAMESIIRLACIARNTDYWEIGRTMEKLEIELVGIKALTHMAASRSSQPNSQFSFPAYWLSSTSI